MLNLKEEVGSLAIWAQPLQLPGLYGAFSLVLLTYGHSDLTTAAAAQGGKAFMPSPPLALTGDNCQSHPPGASCGKAGFGLVEQDEQWKGWLVQGRACFDGSRIHSLMGTTTDKVLLSLCSPLQQTAGLGDGELGQEALLTVFIPVQSCCRSWEPRLCFPL